MKIRTKMMAFGAIAALLVSGAVLAFLPSTEVAATDETPVVTADDTSIDAATLNLSVNVQCWVEGESATIAGVNVTVYTVSVTEGENNTTIVIERVAEGQTDANGNVTFQLPKGEYAVSASYQGLRGFDWVNLTEDQITTVKLHGFGWDMMGPHRIQCDNSSCDRSCDRDHMMDRDANSSCGQQNGTCEMRAWMEPGWAHSAGL